MMVHLRSQSNKEEITLMETSSSEIPEIEDQDMINNISNIEDRDTSDNDDSSNVSRGCNDSDVSGNESIIENFCENENLSNNKSKNNQFVSLDIFDTFYEDYIEFKNFMNDMILVFKESNTSDLIKEKPNDSKMLEQKVKLLENRINTLQMEKEKLNEQAEKYLDIIASLSMKLRNHPSIENHQFTKLTQLHQQPFQQKQPSQNQQQQHHQKQQQLRELQLHQQQQRELEQDKQQQLKKYQQQLQLQQLQEQQQLHQQQEK